MRVAAVVVAAMVVEAVAAMVAVSAAVVEAVIEAGTLAAIEAGTLAAIEADTLATDTEVMDTEDMEDTRTMGTHMEDTRTTATDILMGAGSRGHTGVSFTSAIEIIRTKRPVVRRVFYFSTVDSEPGRPRVPGARSGCIARQLACLFVRSGGIAAPRVL